MEKLTFESGEHYFKGLETFKEKSGELVRNTQILFQRLPPVIRNILQTIRGSEFNVLSVGSADGDIDFRVLKIVDAELQNDEKFQHMKIFNRAIEPNHHHTAIYKNAIGTLPKPLKSKTTFDLREQKFEEYTEEFEREDSTKFHLVHFYHSMYYLDMEQTLKHCFHKELQGNGHILVVVMGRGSLNHSAYTAAIYQVYPELHVHDPQDSYDMADRVIQVAVKNGWKYEIVPQECVLDVTEVFDEHSIKGNLLLDFMTYFKDFRTTADKAHVEKVLSVIRDETVEKDGKRVGRNYDVFIVIRK